MNSGLTRQGYNAKDLGADSGVNARKSGGRKSGSSVSPEWPADAL